MLNNYYEPYIYCISTESKYINIENIVFFDWDEITEEEVSRLKTNLKYELPFNFNKNMIHCYLDSGFSPDTKIELEDGRCVNIKDIEINDILKFGENVLGIVKIDTENLNQVVEYNINNNLIVGSNNLIFKDETLGTYKTTLTLCGNQKLKPKYLFNLITDSKTFKINNVDFLDYRFCLEHYLIKNSFQETILSY
jgi:hypothetical protein